MDPGTTASRPVTENGASAVRRTFAEAEREHARLAILRLLEQDTGYTHNETVIRRGLEYVGHAISGDQVRTELHWLEEQGFVTVDRVGGLWVARITGRGCDVATGRARTAGVARIRPE